jgi:nicotinamidase-related amidase
LITIEGKEVFTELTELVDPAHTALLLVDMQRDFVESDGVFGELGVDLFMYRDSLPRMARLLSDARRASALVVHVQNTALPARLSALLLMRHRFDMATADEIAAVWASRRPVGDGG